MLITKTYCLKLSSLQTLIMSYWRSEKTRSLPSTVGQYLSLKKQWPDNSQGRKTSQVVMCTWTSRKVSVKAASEMEKLPFSLDGWSWRQLDRPSKQLLEGMNESKVQAGAGDKVWLSSGYGVCLTVSSLWNEPNIPWLIRNRRNTGLHGSFLKDSRFWIGRKSWHLPVPKYRLY